VLKAFPGYLNFGILARLFEEEDTKYGHILPTNFDYVISKLITLVHEFRNDDEGEYIHLVTLWETTLHERRRFDL
jgi:hypothetical protein